MTQQFKFGDRVRNEEGNEFVYLRGYLSSCTLATEDGSLYRCSEKHVTLIPHPDTVRLDWLIKRNFDFQKCYDMGGRWWYEDNSFDEIEGTEGMTEREAIDKVMEKETEK